MKKPWFFNLTVLLGAVFLGLLLCEAAARLISRADEDGQVYFRGKALLPYRFPSEMVRKKIAEYEAKKSEVYIIDDPLLGWTIGPHRKSQNGLYLSNSLGIRSDPREYPWAPLTGTLRIAIFGDSFTHGDEEPLPKTWGKLLEDDLNRAGAASEVINFGVPGFGIDQAFLRWRVLGSKFHPDIAVFGFQAENMKRTVNIFRQMYSRKTDLVFTKPRFVLTPEDKLNLVNSPVIPPERVAGVMRNLPDSPLAEYEYWYNPRNYSSSAIFKSRLISLCYSLFSEPEPDCRDDPGVWDPRGEPTRVTLAILREFVREVAASGALPIIVHIPRKEDLQLLEKGKEPAHYQVLRELRKDGAAVVDPAEKMKGQRGLFKHSHYSSKGGGIVADELAGEILKRTSAHPERGRR